MNKVLFALFVSTAALAVEPAASPDGVFLDPSHRGGPEQHLARMKEALQLSDADTEKLQKTMSQLEGQRAPLQQKAQQARETLERAAQGDLGAQAHVDEAAASLLDARTRLMQLHSQTMTTFAQGLTPQQKAKLALFFDGFGHQGHGKQGPAGKGLNRPQ